MKRVAVDGEGKILRKNDKVSIDGRKGKIIKIFPSTEEYRRVVVKFKDKTEITCPAEWVDKI